MIGEPKICTNYLTTPTIDDYNQIKCDYPSNKPQNCTEKTNCVPTSDGAIKIYNCQNVTKMLMFLNRSDSEERLVSADNITHLIIGMYKKKFDSGRSSDMKSEIIKIVLMHFCCNWKKMNIFTYIAKLINRSIFFFSYGRGKARVHENVHKLPELERNYNLTRRVLRFYYNKKLWRSRKSWNNYFQTHECTFYWKRLI